MTLSWLRNARVCEIRDGERKKETTDVKPNR